MLNDFIRCGTLKSSLIRIFNKIHNEKVEKQRWEFYIARVYDITFLEYVKECEQEQKLREGMTDKELKSVFDDSSSILDMLGSAFNEV